MQESAKYLKLVEWSEEDNCYVGSVLGWIGDCCHGDDESEVYKELCQIVEENIELYAEQGLTLPPATAGKEFSGKFQLRAGPELHQALAIRAAQAGDSLNSYCVKVLRQAVTQGPPQT